MWIVIGLILAFSGGFVAGAAWHSRGESNASEVWDGEDRYDEWFENQRP